MADDVTKQGFFSLLRWRSDVARDEARNVAVVLVSEKGEFGGVRAAPLSSISSRLRDQGLLDEFLLALRAQFEAHEKKPGLQELETWRGEMRRSLYLSEPRRVAVDDEETVLDALYKAFLATRGGSGRSRHLSKASVLERAVDALRRSGYSVQRGAQARVGDFVFDALIEGNGSGTAALEALSFAVPRKDWSPVEKDAGHFLYALNRARLPGRAIIEPPSEESHDGAAEPYERVSRWLADDQNVEEVETLSDLVDQPLPV